MVEFVADELAHQLKDSGAAYIVTTPDLLDTVTEATRISGPVKVWWCISIAPITIVNSAKFEAKWTDPKQKSSYAII